MRLAGVLGKLSDSNGSLEQVCIISGFSLQNCVWLDVGWSPLTHFTSHAEYKTVAERLEAVRTTCLLMTRDENPNILMIYPVDVRAKDFESLKPRGYLTDSVIEAYLRLLQVLLRQTHPLFCCAKLLQRRFKNAGKAPGRGRGGGGGGG